MPGGVLAVFAHPDDESLLAGGTLAACAAAGRRVAIVSMTRGERGPGGLSGLGEVREAELQAAAPLRNASTIPTASWATSMRKKPRKRSHGWWSASGRRR